MARDVSDATPIATQQELVSWIAEGEKPKEAWRLGTEHEKIPFYRKDRSPVPYEGKKGIRTLLDGLESLNGWEPIIENGHPIGSFDEVDGGAISLEPGGQFELSGAPLKTLHETAAETAHHVDQVKAIGEELDIAFLTLGMSPLWTRAQTPIMPKARYRIMTDYMPKVGSLGLDMMYRTATVQVNLDFASESDLARKMRVSLALQPIATAIFANSPFTDGKPNGFLSMRSQIWRDTDNARAGMLPFVFEKGFGYERYVEWALDVPMYFIKRGDVYHDVAGSSFRDLLAGRHPAMPGERATRSDWANHVSTIFPEVRLKRYIEMRGADVGDPARIVALSAFWVGLLYDESALDQAWQLVKDWSEEDREKLRADVPKHGLATKVSGRTVQDVARDALSIAYEGLRKRQALNDRKEDETIYLAPLDEIVGTGRTPAQILLDRFHGPWSGSLDPLFSECVF